MTRRAMLCVLFIACLVSLPVVSHAAPAEFRVFFDDDNSIATGCTVAGMPGVDQILITRIDLGATTATVTGTSRQVCQGDGTLGAAIPLAVTGWPAAYNSEMGDLMVETRIPFGVFDNPAPGQLQKMRIGVDARQGALVHIALAVPPDNTPVHFPVPAKGKRRSVAAPGAVRVILLDGIDTDWTGLKNKFHNIAAGGVAGWRMSKVLAFANTHDDFLYLAFYANVSDEAPFAADDEYSREQGEGLTVPGINGLPTVLANDIDPNGDPLSATLVTPPSGGDVILDSTGGFTYTPTNPNAVTADSFEYRASDGDLDSNVATVTIVVDNGNNSPNKAPSFTKGPDISVLEDALTQFINNWATNISAGAGENGQAVSFEITGNTNPSLFEHLPQVSPSGQLSFTPAEDAFGSATISIRIVDDGGTANGGVDESAVQTFVISIDPVNDEPTFTAGSDVTVSEDSGSYSATWATGISAGPNESQTVSFLLSNDNNGLFSSQPAVASNGTLTFTPATNAHGSATVTVVIVDNGSNSPPNDNTGATAQFTITVSSLNDSPSFNAGPSQTVNEDAPAQTVNPWATAISPGPADESGQTVTFNITGNSNPGLFSAGPSIDSAGVLTYTPAANANGSANITITLSDNGSPAATSAPQTFTITVNAVNDEPTFTPGSDVAVNEDSGVYSAMWATGISAGPNEAGQIVSFLVSNDNNGLFSGQPAIDSGGTLTFTPAPNAQGSATVTVTITDNGSNAAPNDNTGATVQFTIIVNAVNDPPSFSAGPNQTVNEDAGAQTVNPWATAINPGPADESGQTVTFNITGNSNPGLFSAGPSIDSAGVLTYTPADDVSGFANITITLSDNGAPVATSAPQSFTITVNSVNDEPSFTSGGDVVASSDTGAYSQSNWATNIVTGPADESSQTVMFEITGNTNTGLFTAGPSIDPSGTLSFTPVAGISGSATITVQMRDSGLTANGGDDLSAPATFTITLDSAPAVSATTPANGATGVVTNATVTVSFDENVDVTGSWFQIVCGTSGTHTTANSNVTGGPGTFIIDPNADFAQGETCSTTIFAAQVTDQDVVDGPNTMAANHVFSFSTDAQPIVTATNPPNGQVGITTNANVTITFSEPVSVTGTWFEISCATSGMHDPSNSNVSGGPATFTIDPTDFVQGELCSATVYAAQVSDVDANDPLDNPAANYLFNFTIDAEPSVVSTTPANADFTQQPNTDVTIVFSEAVNVTGNWFSLNCGTSGTRTPANTAVTTSDDITFTLNPNSDFAVGETCTSTIVAALVSDQDGNDPPDVMSADYNFTFGFDAPPSVTATNPADAATNLATNTDVTITFSENVTLTAGWLSITCGVTTITDANGAVTGGPQVYTFNPTADLPEGSTCNATVLAANVADDDANDPPDNMTANYNFSFTTDAPPSITATSPANGATNQASNTDVVITFDEAVNIGGGTWFTIVCDLSGTHDPGNSATSGSGTAVVTINPANFTQGETCNATIFAAEVSDADANDPPNLMSANYLFSFSIDAAPSVTAATPVNGSTNIATNTNLSITFSEPVTITNSSVTISCANSGAHTVAVSGGPTIWTVNPDTDFATGELCSVSVLAAQVADNDSNDPPDNMLANFDFSFTTDDPPSVTSTTPANGNTVAPSANVDITFSETVDVTGAWFDITCTVSGAHSAAVTGGPTTFSLNPDTDFTGGESCTVTIFAAQVDDQDAGDPPANMTANHQFTFNIDAAPAVLNTTPADTATGVVTNANVTINFSEPVNATGSAFTISCTVSGLHTYATGLSPLASFTLNPDTDFTPGESCTVTVAAAEITDADAFDPPDNMAADYVFTFTLDAAPAVSSTTPANAATDISAGADVTVTFTEPVTAAAGSFTISCATSGAHTFALTGGPTTWTLNPDANFSSGELCTVTVLAAGVADTDANDPPDNMLANHVFTFTIDIAPSVTATTPADDAISIATNVSLTIDFSESVNLTATPVTISCVGSGLHTYTVSAGPATSFTINPDTDFAIGELCTVTVSAADVSDNDANDPPDNMLANYVFDFTTDFDPTVLSTTPADNAITGPDSDITVTFSEAVSVTDPWFTVSCTTSGSHTAVVTGGPTTFTLNPDTGFTAGETCTVTIVAAQVEDQDLGDPPNNMLGDYVFDFTVDGPPSIVTTSPTNGATDQATNIAITITYDEAVTAGGTAYTIECPAPGNTQAFTLGGDNTAVHTLTPNAALPAGVTCTVSVLAAQIADADTNDPPDNMMANYSFTFSTDAAPIVTSTVPTDTATGVTTDASITLNFSESVNLTAAPVTISCATSGAHNVYTVSASPNTTFTIDPSVDFFPNELCTVTVLAPQVSDADANDPPNNPVANYVFTFTTDARPSVVSTTPANGATNRPTDTNIVITFSETVNAPSAAFTIECPAAGNLQAFTVSGDTTNVVTLNPDADLPAGVTCTVTVLAAQISDVDANDPPDNMASNHVFTFTTDAAPAVTTTVPANSAIDIAKTSNITINFSENVDVTASSFTIKCPSSGPAIPFTFVGASINTNTVTLNPDTDLVSGELCEVTVLANQVADTDANDPPNNMAANHVFSFGVEPDAIDDAHPHTHVGNVPSNSATFFKVTTNDVSANAFTISAFDGTTVNGGTIVLQTSGANMGEFTYNPPPGFEGPDTFTYTIQNTHGTDTATVTINVSGMVWFIDQNDAVGPFDGRLGSPFQTLAQFEAVNGNADVGNARNPQANDNIFLYQSGTAYNGPVTLENSQRLIGQDSATAAFGAGSITGLVAAPSQSALPGVNGGDGVFVNITSGGNGVVLAQNNQVRGLRFGANTTMAISGTNFGTLFMRDALVNNSNGGGFNLSTGTMDVILASFGTTNGTHGLNLNNVGGSFNASGAATINTPSVAGINITGNSPTISHGGTITTSGRPALLTSNMTGGSITLGTVNVSGTGAGNDAVTLDGTGNEVNLTIANAIINVNNMDDGVTLQDLGAGSDVIFSAGSITANGATRRVIEFVGTTNCTCNFSAIPLNANTSDGLSLGSGQLGTYTFQDIDVNSPNGGIGVQVVGDANSANTDSSVTFRSIDINTCSQAGINVHSHSGSFTVSGTGGANSGGSITNCTQRGARFGNATGANGGAKNISLTDMSFTSNGTANLAAAGTCGDAANATNTNCAANIDLQDVTTATLTRITANGSAQIGINGRNVADLTLTTITANLNGNEALEDGIQLVNLTTTSPKTWQDLNLTNNASRQLEVRNLSGTNNVTISKTPSGTLFFGNTSFPTLVTTPTSNTNAQGILWNGSGSANVTVSVQDATFARNFSTAFHSDIAGSASANVTVNGGSMIDNGLMLDGGGVGTGNFTYTLTNLTSAYSVPANTNSSPIGILKGVGSSGTFIGNISNNQIHNGSQVGAAGPCDGCPTMLITNGGSSGSHSITISGNTIRHSQNGIVNITSGINVSNDTSQMNVTLTNNTFSDPDEADNDLAVTIVNGTDPGDTSKTCATITGNNISDPAGAGSWNASALIRLRHVQNNQQFKLASAGGGYTGGATDTTAVANFLNANNILSSAVTAAGISLGGGSFVGGTSCP